MNQIKKVLLIFALITIGNTKGIGQVVHDFTTAKAIALAENKLIILDFWATWCKPCLRMDEEVWETEEFEKLHQQFVLLKVDITINKKLAARYKVNFIPRVLILTANEDLLYDKKGFRGANEYFNILNSFPETLGELNEKLIPLINQKTVTSNEHYNLAEEFRSIGSTIENKDIKRKILSKSKFYFKKCEKNAASKELKQMAILSQLRNDAYLGKYKKVIKKIDKLKLDDKNIKASEMKKFILAYCYKNQGKRKELRKVSKQIENEKLLVELND